MCQNTYFKVLDGKYIYIPPFDFDPPEGYQMHENFPNCCDTHSTAYKLTKEYFENFPNCCDTHKELSQNTAFRIEHYKDFPERLLNVISYTEYNIAVKINNDDWFKDITDYIECCWESLGHPPTLTSYYFYYVQYFINNPPKDVLIPEDKRKKLNAYINNILDPDKKTEAPDLNLLSQIYMKWKKVFPFQLVFFEGIKDKFEKTLPILAKDPEVNMYSGIAKAPLQTPEGLLETLVGLTKEILKLVNTKDLYKDGKISEYTKQGLELINSTHEIRQVELLDELSKGERKYVTIIKRWLVNEKTYFRDLSNFVSQPPPKKVPTKAEILREKLTKYGFENVQKVKDLAPVKRDRLINKIADNNLPYQVAMLNYLGYFDYLLSNHFTSKFQIYNHFDGILKGDEREIKGNYSVLSPISKENKNRYKAYLFKEIVEKDYQTIK